MKTLLAWYDLHKRTLPWRRTRDGYRLFISELMLQQTQVDRVLPKYRAWIKQFSSWKTLASASTADLLHAWAGLGYNRRALQAREAARHVALHGEPTNEKEWRHLKGVGPYTAAALTEFANHERAIVIDTNIRRVVGRAFLGRPMPKLSDDPRITKALDRITPLKDRHWDIPQAFMDLGSLVCVPRIPCCEACPLKNICKVAPKFLSGSLKLVAAKKKSIERRHRDKKHPDRIFRGRILAAIRTSGPINLNDLGTKIDESFTPSLDSVWLEKMCTRLAKDGLLTLRQDGTVSLPYS